LNAEIGGFMDFFWFRAATSLHHSQGGATVLILYAIRYDCNKGVLFYPKFPRCTISLYCERNNLLFSTFLMHSIWWNGLQCNLWYFRWCCHLGNRFTTPSLVLGVVKHLYYSHAQVHMTLIDCIDWFVIFLRAKAATAFIAFQPSQFCPSVCLSVCPSDRHTGGTT